jgi:hypothetical protein
MQIHVISQTTKYLYTSIISENDDLILSHSIEYVGKKGLTYYCIFNSIEKSIFTGP